MAGVREVITDQTVVHAPRAVIEGVPDRRSP
jgi:hypothetical protein